MYSMAISFITAIVRGKNAMPEFPLYIYNSAELNPVLLFPKIFIPLRKRLPFGFVIVIAVNLQI